MSIKHTFRSESGVQTKELTPLKAIRAFCIECMGFHVQEVRGCPAPKCPLHPFRNGNAHTGRSMSENHPFYELHIRKQGESR
jgi:hypothetical protein